MSLSRERLTRRVYYGPIKVIPDGGGPVIVAKPGTDSTAVIPAPNGDTLTLQIEGHVEQGYSAPHAHVAFQGISLEIRDGDKIRTGDFQIIHEKPNVT